MTLNIIDEDTAYLILTRDRYGFKISELRKGKPAMRAGQIAVRVRLRLPRKVWDEFIPEVTATIGESDLIPPTIEVIPAPVDES
jgi:hypothetical protein